MQAATEPGEESRASLRSELSSFCGHCSLLNCDTEGSLRALMHAINSEQQRLQVCTAAALERIDSLRCVRLTDQGALPHDSDHEDALQLRAIDLAAEIAAAEALKSSALEAEMVAADAALESVQVIFFEVGVVLYSDWPYFCLFMSVPHCSSCLEPHRRRSVL
jgi:hypothetical protein